MKNQPTSIEALTIATKAAKTTGKLLLKQFHQKQTVNDQLRHTVKLQIDVDCENLIRGIIQSHFPNHQILGEELGQESVNSDFLWIIDPLDGTSNYLTGVPHFCVSIACQFQNQAYCGVIFDPFKDELFTVHRDGTFLVNGQPAQVSTESNPLFSTLVISFPGKEKQLKEAKWLYRELLEEVGSIRNSGSTALDLAYLAAGRYDSLISRGIYLWDIAAGCQMLEKAGGSYQTECLGAEAACYNITAHNGQFGQLPLEI